MTTRTLFLYFMGAMLFVCIEGATVIPNGLHNEENSEMTTTADAAANATDLENTTRSRFEDVASSVASVDATAVANDGIPAVSTATEAVEPEGDVHINTKAIPPFSTASPIDNGTNTTEEDTTHIDHWDPKCGMHGCASNEICAERIQSRCFTPPCNSTFECHLKVDDHSYKCGYNTCKIGQKCKHTGINCFLAPCYVSTECSEASDIQRSVHRI